MTFHDIQKKYKKTIDDRLEEIILQHKVRTVHVGTLTNETFSAISDRITNGKTIRGSLCMFMTNALGAHASHAIDTASALELFQLGLLVHDDIMDEDDVRRGKPTIHALFAQKFNSPKAGESIGLCIGDMLFFLGYKTISSSKLPDVVKVPIASYASEKFIEVGIGQMDDVVFGFSKKLPTEKEILTMYEYKTSHYTFSLPFIAGALISGKKELISDLEKLGRALGILFQVRDDVLDIFGKSEKLGKPVGSDIRENKKTIIYSLLFKQANTKDKKLLQSYFGNKKLTQKNIEIIKQLLVFYKIDREIEMITKQLEKDAEKIIGKLPISNNDREVLKTLLQYVAHREK